MHSQLDVREEADMTPMNSLDSVLRAGLEAATQSQSRTVEGDKLADARADVLQGSVATKPLLLQPDNDQFSFEHHDPNDTDDARLNRALRSLAEKFQAGQAAQAAVADEPAKASQTTTGEETTRQLAYVGQWVGATTSSAPVVAPAPSAPPAVPPPSGSGSTGGSTSGSGSGTNNGGTNNGNG